MVGGLHVDAKNVSKACTSMHAVLQRTLVKHTARVTLVRGRPSNGTGPDRRSGHLANTVRGTSRAVGVALISRIVIYSNYFCDFTSRKLV